MDTDALIFDMDGTLWDASDKVTAAWNKIINDSPLVKEPVTAERIKGLMGKRLDDIGKNLFPDIGEAERTKLLDACCKYEDVLLSESGGTLFDGVEETLKELSKRTKLYIVSNCQNGYIEAFFKYHKLNEYFKDYQCSGSTGKTKGEVIMELIARNKIKSAYYVGDTQIDYEATRKACIPFVYASYGFGEVHNYEYKINSFTDLAAMF